MSRAARAGDFHVDVEGLGRFLFGRRTMGDVYKIRGRYNQITGGFYDEDGRMADYSALGYVTIQTLLVEAPDSFNIDTLDPIMDDAWDEKILKIFSALIDKEGSFRQKPTAGSASGGPGNGAVDGAVVSQDVPPSANGS
jgi:hypothetical protein